MNRSIMELLTAARDSSKLELSEFGHIFPPRPEEPDYVPYPTNEKEVTAFIKARVRLHHSSWITGPIEEVMKQLKTMVEGQIGR